MRKIFVLLLAVTLSTSAMASGGSDSSQPKKQKQVTPAKQKKLNDALEILKSGKFKIEAPLTREELKIGLRNDRTRTVADLNISDQRYDVRSAEVDSVKGEYSLTYAYQQLFQGSEYVTNVVYNFNTGYLRVDVSYDNGWPGFYGNYSCIRPLNE